MADESDSDERPGSQDAGTDASPNPPDAGPHTSAPTIRVEVAAAEPAPKPGPTAAKASVSAEFAAYSEQTQAAAKWVIGALAAVGALVFGAGPVVAKTTLDWTDDRSQLYLAWVLGALGLLGIGTLIACAAYFLIPRPVTLWNLPESLRKQIQKTPQEFFPTGSGTIETVEQFQTHLTGARRTVAHDEARVRDLDLRIKLLGGAEKAPTVPQVALYVTQRAEIADVALPLEKLTLAGAEETRLTLLERGRHAALSEKVTGLKAWAVLGLILVAGGGIGFQLVLSSPAASDDDDSAGGSASATATTMTRLDGAAGDALWEALDLQACETAPGVVPIVLLGGAGTEADPYAVQTFPAELGCEVRQFTVISSVAVVDSAEPDEITITYTPASTTSASPALPTGTGTPAVEDR